MMIIINILIEFLILLQLFKTYDNLWVYDERVV